MEAAAQQRQGQRRRRRRRLGPGSEMAACQTCSMSACRATACCRAAGADSQAPPSSQLWAAAGAAGYQLPANHAATRGATGGSLDPRMAAAAHHTSIVIGQCCQPWPLMLPRAHLRSPFAAPPSLAVTLLHSASLRPLLTCAPC